MKSLVNYIFEKEEEEKSTERGKLKFVIWKEDGKTVKWLKDNEDYQKIECQYEEDPDYDEGIKVDFLLGRMGASWKLWAGKPGVVTYADEPYKDLETQSFKDAILAALDEAENLIEQIKEEPNNWVQYYIST